MRKRYTRIKGLLLAAVISGAVIGTERSLATPIEAEAGANSTGTLINNNGNSFDISGGKQSGANLFHSFEKFGLDSGQIANFLSSDQIKNILGRVVGGDPSVINGILKVTVQGGGGNPNLFLMNPAGIVFGSNASLNVPASFTATTATGIGFGSSWFNAMGSNDYAALVGNPNAFAFSTSNPGAIVNAGNLSVGMGQNLTLVGGTVINKGQMSAPGGQISIFAVPGESTVRVSQQGMVLSLDVQPLTPAGSQPGKWTLPIKSLPELLTGGDAGNATGMSVSNDGMVMLTGSGISTNAKTGTAIVSGTLNASNAAASQKGGRVEVLGNQVKLISQAQVDVSGDAGAGTVLIGGDYQGQGNVPKATETFVGRNATIKADSIASGDGGKVIVWADGTTRFYGNISARGGANAGNGGFVEVSGKQNLAFDGVVDLGAPAGTGGQLLLDPAKVIISSFYDGQNDNALDDGQITANEGGSSATFYISTSRLVQALNSGNVSIAVSDSSIFNSIDVESAIDASGNTNSYGLTLTAPVVNLYSSIKLKGGDVNLNASQSINLNTFSNISSNGGNITFNGPVVLNSSDPQYIPPTIDSRGSTLNGNITFNNTINSRDTTPSNINLRAGNVAVLDAIGGTNPLGKLEIFGNDINLKDYTGSSLRASAEGNLSVLAQGDLTLGSSSDLYGSSINLQTQGNVIVDNSKLYSGNNTEIKAQSLTITGNSTLDAANLILQTQAGISLKDSQLETKVDLKLQAQGDLTIKNSQLVSNRNVQLEGQNISLEESKLVSRLKDMQLLAQNKLTVRDSAANPSVVQADGNLSIQANQAIDIQTLNHPQSVFESSNNLSLVSNGDILGDGRFISGGKFSVLNSSDAPGNFRQSPTISSDRIISSEGDVTFGNYEGPSLKVEARGSITGGDIKITGPDTSLFSGTDPDIPLLSRSSAVILRAGVSKLQNYPNNSQRTLPEPDPNLPAQPSSPGSITVGNIATLGVSVSQDGNPVILSATGDIKSGTIRTAGPVNLSSTAGNIEVKYINSIPTHFDYIGARGSYKYYYGGYDVDITAAGLFRATDSFTVNTREDSVRLVDNPELLDAYSQITGTPKDELIANDTRIQILIDDLPTSILASPGIGGGEIKIKHGGNSFVTGPVISRKDGPALVDGGSRRNVQYSPLNVPTNSSGTAGAILLTNFDASLAKTFQDQTFTQNITNNQINITFLPKSQPQDTGTVTTNPQSQNTGIVATNPQPQNTTTVATNPQPQNTTTVATNPQPQNTSTVATNPQSQNTDTTTVAKQDSTEPLPGQALLPQSEANNPSQKPECKQSDTKVAVIDRNSTRDGEQSREVRATNGRKPLEDECDRRDRRDRKPADTNPVSAPDAAAPDKKQPETETLWKF